MNIIHTTTSLAPEFGGPARTVPALCAELAALGNRVVLVYLDFGGGFKSLDLPHHPNLTYQPLEVKFRAGLRPIWISGFLSALLEQGAAKQELIFHDHGIWLPSSGQVLNAAARLGAKTITTPRGMLEPWALQYKGLRKKAAWLLYQKNRLNRNTALQATSFEEAYHLKQLGLTPPIAVIPNGTEIPDPEDAEGRQNTDERTLLFLSRIHPKKGLINLVKAIAFTRPPGWKVRIAGYDEDGHQSAVQNAIREQGVEDYFSFIGPVEDNLKWDLYREADLFVLPSFSENYGMVVAEALASGTPVITTTGTPWRELIEYNSGWWVEPTPESLAACLKEVFLLSNSALKEMGQNGRRLIQAKYSWPAVARQMNEVYSWMLGLREKPPDSVICF